MDSQYGRTDFRAFTHVQLVEMLTAGRPVEVAAAADGWRELANLLDDVALTLERQNTSFHGLWEGPAADAHARMIAALVDGVRQAAWATRRTGDQVGAAAEALRRAQEQMATFGPPQQLLPPDEAVLAAASTPLPYGQGRAEAAQRQVTAIRAIQGFQRAQAAATAVAAAAAAIMEELRDRYLNIELPRLPAVADPPTLAPDGTPVYSTAPGQGGRPPLFTDLWGNGLSAAAGMPPAQVLQPYLPGQGQFAPGAQQPVGPSLSNVDDLSRSPLDLSPRLPIGGDPLPDLGSGLGGGSLGSGGGLGGFDGGPGTDAPVVGQSSMAPMIDPAAAAAGRAAVGGVGVPPFLGGGFAPPGGGGGDLGGRASAVAAWLVGEVEEFGVKSPIVPDLVE
jgi:hypothetical protein